MLGAGDPMTPELGGADRLMLGVTLSITLLVDGTGWLAVLTLG